MPVTLQVETHDFEMARIVDDVFQTMLDMGVAPFAGPPVTRLDSLTAAVLFVGDWKGALFMQYTLQQALMLTSRLMPGRTPTYLDEDVRDTLGEIANMVGGNLKSVLPPGVALSIPAVVEGTDFAMHLCGGNRAHTQSFVCEAGIFAVTLVQVEK